MARSKLSELEKKRSEPGGDTKAVGNAQCTREAKMIVDLTTPNARRFITIFRRECMRTAIASAHVTKGAPLTRVPSLENCTTVEVNGYDEWAAAAFVLSEIHMSPSTQATLACAMSRSPICEVAFTEIKLSEGHMPYDFAHEYNAIAFKFPHVRRWPKERGLQIGTLSEMMRVKTEAFNQKDLLMVDTPWLIPAEVKEDTAYAEEIPLSSVKNKSVDFDVAGLWKRIEVEMMVIEAIYDPKWARKLDEMGR